MRAFIDGLGVERTWASISIERLQSGFQLRHVADRERDPATLQVVPIVGLRKLATYNGHGQFRPLRAAPDLVSGWICRCFSDDELGRTVQELYPGSIADWYAVQRQGWPGTNYREFTDRQSGMYRVTQLLSDAQAANVIRACCPSQFCLKQRLWSVEGLPADDPRLKSAIPCLEPCAVLLELVRKAARIEQEPKMDVQLARSELESLLLAARSLLQLDQAGERVGNIGAPTNPRRLQLVLEKFGSAISTTETQKED